MYLRSIVIASCFVTSVSRAQETDSLKTLAEVVVRAFDQDNSSRYSALSVYRIDPKTDDRSNRVSLLGILNTIPGVRMEERSPGSLRISIRGSSLRSPFGVRNLKIYWNDIPVTDPGGNSYFNQVAHNNFSYAEIFKGPASSLYGSGTGGLLLLQMPDSWSNGAAIEYVTGSFSMHNVLATVNFGRDATTHRITYAHNQSEGYRNHSAFRRDNFSWVSRLKTGDRHRLTASLLFADLQYETPGALTFAEYRLDPKAARPAGGGFPSAEQARAGIFQKNITTGLTSEYSIRNSLKSTTTFYAAYADVRNPAVRNYERRKEPHFGGRSFFSWRPANSERWKVSAGAEIQKGFFNTLVTKNRNGQPDSLLTNDDIDYTTYFAFAQASGRFGEDWILNAGLSVNRTVVRFLRLSQYPVTLQRRKYRSELAPAFSLRRNLGAFYLKGTISRGFSPPTITELLPSTGVISTDLEAEYGWNHELSAGTTFLSQRMWMELTGFYFRLNSALVQRRDNSGADFFVNAGNIRQKGLEILLRYRQEFATLLSRLSAQTGFTYYHFRYGSFVKGSEDFSGRLVPSVPQRVLSTTLDLTFRRGISIGLNHYAASSIFLNDANTAVAAGYHLIGGRLGYRKSSRSGTGFEIYIGADNLLNANYSLGNDINAAGGRYYNAAPDRNFFVGARLDWIRNRNSAQ